MAQPKPQRIPGDDPVRVDPSHYKLEMENEKVRVLRVHYNPHERSVMHGHPETVVICLRDCRATFTYPDGRTEEIAMKAGDVVHNSAFVHLPENTGDTPLDVILVELKS